MRMDLRPAVVFLMAAARLSPEAQAGVYTLSPEGRPVRWAEPRLELAGNPGNASGLAASTIFSAVTRGLARWKQASGGRVTFDYWQGTDPNVYETNSERNGISSFYFASQDPTGSAGGLGSSVLGLTQVWYDTSSGQILETDIVLNDRDFQFTANPADTSGYGSGSYPNYAYKTRVFIENVLTHELGHALGLSHSGHEQSTMLFMEAPGQAQLSCDDQAMIRAYYPGNDGVRAGALEGQVLTPSGQALFGAHVQAISVERGSVLGAAITLSDGRFRIGALEPGDYVLLVEPYAGGVSALPGYYGSARSNVCPGGRNFSRTIPMGAGFEPRIATARMNQATPVPAISVACPGSPGAAVIGPQGGSDPSGAPTAIDAASGRGRFAVVDRFSGGGALYYRLSRVSGSLRIRVASHSLYSPVHAAPRLLDSSGNSVAFSVSSPRDQGPSGSAIWDTELAAEGLAPGEYFLQLTPSSISPTWYPAGNLGLDSVGFFVLTGVLGAPAAPLSDWYPDQARCRQNDSFPAYASPPGNPPRRPVNGAVLGFCARVRDVDGPTHGPGAGAGDIVSGFLPWVFMALMGRRARRRARALAWTARQALT